MKYYYTKIILTIFDYLNFDIFDFLYRIWLTRNAEKITSNDTCIIQEYLDKVHELNCLK